MRKRIDFGLSASDEKFAGLLALGFNQTEAYRRSHYVKGLEPQTISVRASKLASKPAIEERARAILKELKVDALDSAGEAYSELLSAMKDARAAENWTAYANLMRQRLQVLGMLSETINVRAEDRLTDAQILERLAAGDPHRTAMLKAVLGESEGYARG